MQDGTTAAAKNLLGITDSRHRSCLRFGCLSCRNVQFEPMSEDAAATTALSFLTAFASAEVKSPT
jgi:hypothetical protein